MNEETAATTWRGDLALIIGFSLLAVLIQLAVSFLAGYGIFRDEFYYLACSRRLALGYVDQPPLSIFFLAASRWLLGETLAALRLLPALVGGLTVFMTGLLTRGIGGKRPALLIALVAVTLAPFALAAGSYYSMNCFDGLFWLLAAYLLVLIIRQSRPGLWLLLGVVLGLGLLNKTGVLWLGAGMGLAVLLTPLRRHLLTPWPYLAALLALAIFSPYIAWNAAHGFPHLEFIRNATSQKYGGLTAMDFILGQFRIAGPLAAPVWLAGLGYFLFHRRGREFRALGIIYLAVFLILVANGHSKDEYLSWAYPMLFAGGAVQVACWSLKRGWRWLNAAVPAAVALGGLVIAPFVLAVLPVKTFIAYSRALGAQPRSVEGKELSQLPQFFADRFGWEELARTVAGVYAGLPTAEKPGTFVLARNYGEAGALEFYSRRYALPSVLSAHNNYWLWGKDHLDRGYHTVILIGGNLADHRRGVAEIELAAHTRCRYCMPYENNLPIYIGRGFRRPLAELWAAAKSYD
jgi:4-amino-4-deoxy-L-arabinose transferase-like glycosyltransferase